MAEGQGVAPRDRKNFTEAEFKRELELHHIKLEKGQTASVIYRQQEASVTSRPRSGVFRDFAEYGVHPARVVVQRVLLTVPFIVHALTADQLADEITNQKQRIFKKPEGSKWDEEKEAETRGYELAPGGSVRSRPSVDAAFELVKILRERKSHVDFTPSLQRFMSAFNFYLFKMGGLQRAPVKFFIPSRTIAAVDLGPLVSPKIASAEIEQRILKDPGRWGVSGPDAVAVADIVSLVGELMTRSPFTSEMREIIDWYKTAYRRTQYLVLAKNVLEHQEQMLTILRIRA